MPLMPAGSSASRTGHPALVRPRSAAASAPPSCAWLTRARAGGEYLGFLVLLNVYGLVMAFSHLPATWSASARCACVPSGPHERSHCTGYMQDDDDVL
jgi:hypothetical protein